MSRHGKQYNTAKGQIERRPHALGEALEVLRKAAFAKFDETIEVSLRLGVNPKHADQMVRGTVVLTHGTGKSKRVLVIAAGDKAREAEEAGADFVGGPDLVKKIQEGWLDFDAVVATPDMTRRYRDAVDEVTESRRTLQGPGYGLDAPYWFSEVAQTVHWPHIGAPVAIYPRLIETANRMGTETKPIGELLLVMKIGPRQPYRLK